MFRNYMAFDVMWLSGQRAVHLKGCYVSASQ